jgi:hypothetical protein
MAPVAPPWLRPCPWRPTSISPTRCTCTYVSCMYAMSLPSRTSKLGRETQGPRAAAIIHPSETRTTHVLHACMLPFSCLGIPRFQNPRWRLHWLGEAASDQYNVPWWHTGMIAAAAAGSAKVAAGHALSAAVQRPPWYVHVVVPLKKRFQPIPARRFHS